MTTNEATERYRRYATFFAAIIGGVIISGFALYVLVLIRGALIPFLYAAIIVYLARPFVEMLVKRRTPRMLAVLVAYLVVFSLITLLMLFVVPVLVQQVNELISLFPQALELAEEQFSELRFRFPKELDAVISQAQEQVGGVALSLAANIPASAVGFFGGIFNIVIAWLLAFYILKDAPAINETIMELLPERYRDNVAHIFNEVNSAVGGYLRGQVIIALAVGVMITVWLLILGVEFAFLLGLLSGVLNIVPYLGAIVGGGAAAIVALYDSPQQAILVIIGIAIIQQVDALVISPFVMRHTVNLHPTVIVFALLMGVTLIGFVGLLFAIPIAAALKAILLHFVFNKPVEIAEETQGESV